MENLLSVAVGGAATVIAVNTQPDLKQRLFDIGLVPGTKIKVIHRSPAKNPRAYYFRGTVIALRNCDAENILVSVDEDG